MIGLADLDASWLRMLTSMEGTEQRLSWLTQLVMTQTGVVRASEAWLEAADSYAAVRHMDKGCLERIEKSAVYEVKKELMRAALVKMEELREVYHRDVLAQQSPAVSSEALQSRSSTD